MLLLPQSIAPQCLAPKRVRRHAHTLALSLITLCAIHPAHGSTVTDRIDAYVEPLAAAGQFAGVILVTQDGQIAYERAFGMANRETRTPNTLDTRFCIASITKSMTQVVTIQMLVEGKLALPDSLTKFVPDFPRGDDITVEDLFRFRAGLPHRVMDESLENQRYTAADLVEKARSTALLYEPGVKSMYSSATYSVLARVLEIAGGKPFPELLRDHVFAPSQMTETIDSAETAEIPNAALGYFLEENGVAEAPAKDYSFLVGAGSLFSTAHDLRRYFEAVLDTTYGASVLASLAGDGAIGSNGNANGYRAFASFSRPQGHGYVVMSDLESGANDLLQRDLPYLIEGQPLESPRAPDRPSAQIDAGKLGDYVGAYSRDASRFEIAVKNGALYAGDRLLTPVAPDRFFAYSSYGDIHFVREADGRVSRLTWNSPVWESEWVRE